MDRVMIEKSIAGIGLAVLFACLYGCGQVGKEVTGYITTSDRVFDLREDTLSFTDADVPGSVMTISPDTTVRYQTMDGFGAAITGATCFNLSLMPEKVRRQFLDETFSPHKYGFSYVRVPIGCSDFSLSDYTCCDTMGIDNFALTSEETKYIIPILKEIRAINPGLKIIASPWTCPKWMKVKDLKSKEPYDSWTGGHLNPYYYKDYAMYFVKWIDAFEKEGVGIDAITIQNEPLNRGNSASLFMGWDEQRDFVKKALGPAMREYFPSVKIYAFDHNYNYDNMPDQQKYPLKIYSDAEAKAFLSGAAYHNYGGNRNELLDIHRQAPDMELIFTETSIGVWNQGDNLTLALNRDMEEIGLGTVNNWCKAVIVWNLVLDSDRGPHSGAGACTTCYGAVDVDNETYSRITRNSHYYVIAHLASVVKPGAVRIGAKGNMVKGVAYSVFENTDGTYALVMSNGNERGQMVQIKDGNHCFLVEIPGNAVASYTWKK